MTDEELYKACLEIPVGRTGRFYPVDKNAKRRLARKLANEVADGATFYVTRSGETISVWHFVDDYDY